MNMTTHSDATVTIVPPVSANDGAKDWELHIAEILPGYKRSPEVLSVIAVLIKNAVIKPKHAPILLSAWNETCQPDNYADDDVVRKLDQLIGEHKAQVAAAARAADEVATGNQLEELKHIDGFKD